jgi:hypothetical protein
MATMPASPQSGDRRSNPDEDFVIRPSWRAGRAWAKQPAFVKYRKQMLGFVVAIQLLVLLTMPFTHIPRYLLEMSLGITLLLVLLIPLWLWWYKSAAIRVTSELVVINHFLRRPVVIKRHDIVRVARCGVVQVDVSPILPQPVVFMFGADGRCLVSLWMTRWNWNDLERIWKPLGVSVEGSWGDVVLQAQLGSRFPGAF